MKNNPITDVEIMEAFAGKDFGEADHRRLLALSVLKKALRYHCGHTITQIMIDMGLITRTYRVTERGRSFCYEELKCEHGG